MSDTTDKKTNLDIIMKAAGPGVPVRMINLSKHGGQDLPNAQFGVQQIKSGRADHGDYVLTWHPAIQAIRVDFKARAEEKTFTSGTKGTCTFFVPQAWVTWEV